MGIQGIMEAKQVVVRKRRNEIFFFSSRRRHTRQASDWSSDVCSSDLQLRASHELFHPNVLRARRTLQSLAERGDKTLAPKYARLLDEAEDERQALHALWALNLCHNLHETDELAIRCLQHRFARSEAPRVGKARNSRLSPDP